MANEQNPQRNPQQQSNPRRDQQQQNQNNPGQSITAGRASPANSKAAKTNPIRAASKAAA